MHTRPLTSLHVTAITLLALLLTAAPAAARTWIVRPGGSIQAAIDRAESGDTILILPGEYREHLSIIDKSLTLRSVAGAAATTLVLLDNPDDFTQIGMNIRSTAAASSLRGLTLKTPSISPPHTAMLLESDLEISNCVIGPVDLFAILGGPGLTDLAIVDTSFVDCPIAVRAAVDLDIRGCSFTRCESAITLFFAACPDEHAAISDCTFEECHAPINLPFDQITVDNCDFIRCLGSVRAGSMCAALTVTNSRFSETGREPAIESLGATTIEACAFTGGSGFRTGSAVSVVCEEQVVIRRCHFEGNEGARIGAAISARAAQIEVEACSFLANLGQSAGGIVNLMGVGTSPQIRVHGCDFIDNVSNFAALAIGGVSGATPLASVSACRFIGHTGPLLRVSNTEAGSSVHNCRFTGSQSDRFDLVSAPMLPFVACDIERNTVARYVTIRANSLRSCRFLGNTGGSPMVAAAHIENCLFVGNEGAIANDAMAANKVVGTTIVEHTDLIVRTGQFSGSIVHSSTPPLITSPAIRYSNLPYSDPNPTNIDADPLFIRNPNPGPDQTWGTPDDDYGDLRLQPTSPCIDAADSTTFPDEVTTDLAGAPRFVDDPNTPDTGLPDPARNRPVADMGAYEFQPTTTTPICDLDANGRVNVHDLLTFLDQWLTADPAADLNNDGAVNVHDLLTFIDCFTIR